jgi:uncharacterized protein YdaU (DUF1376 family)
LFYYPFHLRDYTAKTRHLSLMEDLAYRRLLDAYYDREGPLPADPEQCARQIAMREFQAEVSGVLAEFFTLTEAGWTNERCQAEIEKYRGRADKARRASDARWNTRSDAPSIAQALPKHGSSNAFAMPTDNRQPKTRIKKEPLVADEWFDRFWKAYPRREAKPNALAAWVAKVGKDEALAERVIAAVTARAKTPDWTKDGGKFIPLPATYLNAERWNDEIVLEDDDGWLSELRSYDAPADSRRVA